jgi:hypothetical protein
LIKRLGEKYLIAPAADEEAPLEGFRFHGGQKFDDNGIANSMRMMLKALQNWMHCFSDKNFVLHQVQEFSKY